jgi:hypothetical protein
MVLLLRRLEITVEAIPTEDFSKVLMRHLLQPLDVIFTLDLVQLLLRLQLVKVL